MRIQYIGHASILIETAGVSILTDPWLTPSLDRFWEHYPVFDAELAPRKVDIVLLSHHHYDHFHLPSLAQLNRDAVVIFPATAGTRATTAPGGGAFAVPWLLRRLGFQRVRGAQPFESLNLGNLAITCFPSDVNFPELTFLIEDKQSTLVVAGDSRLHAGTRQWLENSRLRPDLAIIPVHSTATDACFRDRDQRDDVQGKRREASEAFREYLRLFQHSAVIPGAFGWRVRREPVPSEESCGWMNHRIFPLTVLDGLGLAEENGNDVRCWGPGDSIELNGNQKFHGEGPYWDRKDLQEHIASEYAMTDATVPLPKFAPLDFGPALNSEERNRIIDFVETRLVPELNNSPFLMQAIELGLKTQLRVIQRERGCGFVTRTPPRAG